MTPKEKAEEYFDLEDDEYDKYIQPIIDIALKAQAEEKNIKFLEELQYIENIFPNNCENVKPYHVQNMWEHITKLIEKYQQKHLGEEE